MDNKLNYDLWIKKTSVEEDFKKDLLKRRIIRDSLKMLCISFVLVILGSYISYTKSIANSTTPGMIILIIAGILFLISIILNLKYQTFVLDKKYFTVYLLYNLSTRIDEGIERPNEKKEMKRLIIILKRLFNKMEVESNYDSFEYNGVSLIKKQLRSLAIYLENKLEQNQIDSLANVLSSLSRKIYNEELISDNFLEKIVSSHGGSLEEKSSRIKNCLIKKGYIWLIIFLVAVIMFGYLFKISKETLFAVIITGIMGIFIGKILNK
jgi:hypothetical protein